MTTTKTYTYSGRSESWKVPANIDGPVHVKLWAPTGNFCGYEDEHGNIFVVGGGYVEGDLTVSPGDLLVFTVGGTGVNYEYAENYGAGNGFNGGGRGPSAHGGSGATDIRQNGAALTDRVAVAGGPGGGSWQYSGGPGGGDTGGAGAGYPNPSDGTGGAGGSQTAGGAGGTGPGDAGGSAGVDGALGQGGNSQWQGSTANATPDNGNGISGGPGGGGYYGGGSGATYCGGGGGSNFVGGLSGTITNTQGDATVPGSSAGDGKIEITYNLAPNAPIPTYPVGNAFIDATLDQTFTVRFSDDDPTDSISASRILYRTGTGSWTDSGKIAGTVAAMTFAAGTFTSLDTSIVEWQAQTWDTSDAASPLSASAYFTPYPPPNTSFVFDPALTGIASRTPTIAGERSDGAKIRGYRIIVVPDSGGDPDTGTILVDTGYVNILASAFTLSVTLPDYDYTNGSSVHVLAKISNPVGVYQHDWTDSGPLTVNIQPPPTPSIVLDFHPYDPTGCEFYAGACIVSWDNPTPDDPDLAAVSVNLYRTEGGVETRIGTGLPINSFKVDWIPAGNTAGLRVPYRVEAVTATGATAESA